MAVVQCNAASAAGACTVDLRWLAFGPSTVSQLVAGVTATQYDESLNSVALSVLRRDLYRHSTASCSVAGFLRLSRSDAAVVLSADDATSTLCTRGAAADGTVTCTRQFDAKYQLTPAACDRMADVAGMVQRLAIASQVSYWVASSALMTSGISATTQWYNLLALLVAGN